MVGNRQMNEADKQIIKEATSNLMRLNGRSDTAYQAKLAKIFNYSAVERQPYFDAEVKLRLNGFANLKTPEDPPNYEVYRKRIDATAKFILTMSTWYSQDLDDLVYENVNFGSGLNMKLASAVASKNK